LRFVDAMNLSNRFRILIALLIAVNACFFGYLFLHVHSRGVPYQEDALHRARVDSLVDVLKREDLNESMVQLIAVSNSSQYMYPGYHTSRKYAEVDLGTMLSSRRCVKVMQEIQKLSSAEQEGKIRKLFDMAFRSHTNGYDYLIKYKDNTNEPFVPQPLLSSTMALCTAMFEAADTGKLKLLSEEFLELDKCQAMFVVKFGALRRVNPDSLALLLEEDTVPDNCFQVNVLRLAAMRASDHEALVAKCEAACNEALIASSDIPVVAWEARTTSFERLVGSPVDTRKGVTVYHFRTWTDEGVPGHRENQELLVHKLRSIVFQE